MKGAELIKQRSLDMGFEFYTNKNQVLRKISKIFSDELEHFSQLLIAFNKEYKCIEKEEIDSIINQVKQIFDTQQSILVNDHLKRYKNNIEELTDLITDHYLRKLENSKVKMPAKEVNNRLRKICKFDYFLLENNLEDQLKDFSSVFAYKYINREDALSDFYRIVKSVKHNLMCDIKNAISFSIDNKEDIVGRYNSEFKDIVDNKEISASKRVLM